MLLSSKNAGFKLLVIQTRYGVSSVDKAAGGEFELFVRANFVGKAEDTPPSIKVLKVGDWRVSELCGKLELISVKRVSKKFSPELQFLDFTHQIKTFDFVFKHKKAKAQPKTLLTQFKNLIVDDDVK